MRAIIYVFILSLFSYNSYGQVAQPIVFKGANTIVITTSVSNDSLFTLTGKILLDNNYTFIDRDKEFKTFMAKGRIPDYGYDLLLNVRVKDSTVIIRGEVFSSGYKFEASYDKRKNLLGISFAEMDRLAKQLPGTIYYEKVKY